LINIDDDYLKLNPRWLLPSDEGRCPTQEDGGVENPNSGPRNKG